MDRNSYRERQHAAIQNVCLQCQRFVLPEHWISCLANYGQKSHLRFVGHLWSHNGETQSTIDCEESGCNGTAVQESIGWGMDKLDVSQQQYDERKCYLSVSLFKVYPRPQPDTCLALPPVRLILSNPTGN